MKGLRVGAVAGMLILAAGCDQNDGPGYLTGALEGPMPLGAAVVDVRGVGILGFEAAASTRVFSAVTPAGVHRVVLVGGAPGDLSFRIRVDDPRSTPPTALLVSASDGDDLPITAVHAFTVRISR
jgi:hypothetical protein